MHIRPICFAIFITRSPHLLVEGPSALLTLSFIPRWSVCRDFQLIGTGTALMTSCQKVSLSKKMLIIEVFNQEFGVNTTKSWSCGHLGGMASIHMEALDGTVQFLVSGRMGMLGNGPRVPVIAHITSFVKGVSKYKFYCYPKVWHFNIETFSTRCQIWKVLS